MHVQDTILSFSLFREHKRLETRVGKRTRSLQQSQRDITLQARLELNLDVEIKTELEPHGLSIGETREHGGLGQASGLLEGLVAAATAAARVDGGSIGRRVVELLFGRENTVRIRDILRTGRRCSNRETGEVGISIYLASQVSEKILFGLWGCGHDGAWHHPDGAGRSLGRRTTAQRRRGGRHHAGEGIINLWHDRVGRHFVERRIT